MKQVKTPVLFAITLIFSLISISLNAQSLTWEKLYNNGSGYESSKIDDESFYICGSGNAGHPAVVMKLNQYGNQIWYRELGNTGTGNANSIVTTDDKGCVVVGYTLGSKAIWKYDSDGNLVWLKNFEATEDLKTLERQYFSSMVVSASIH